MGGKKLSLAERRSFIIQESELKGSRGRKLRKGKTRKLKSDFENAFRSPLSPTFKSVFRGRMSPREQNRDVGGKGTRSNT